MGIQGGKFGIEPSAPLFELGALGGQVRCGRLVFAVCAKLRIATTHLGFEAGTSRPQRLDLLAAAVALRAELHRRQAEQERPGFHPIARLHVDGRHHTALKMLHHLHAARRHHAPVSTCHIIDPGLVRPEHQCAKHGTQSQQETARSHARPGATQGMRQTLKIGIVFRAG